MKVTAEVRGESQQILLPPGSSFADLARVLDLHPDSVLFVVDGCFVPSDAPLSDGMKVCILVAVSGG